MSAHPCLDLATPKPPPGFRIYNCQLRPRPPMVSLDSMAARRGEVLLADQPDFGRCRTSHTVAAVRIEST